MSRYNTYRHYNATEPKKLTLEIKEFKGVDYTPSQLNVAENHAVDIKNIIYKDRTDQKRDSYEQIAKLTPTEYYIEDDGFYYQRTNTTNINGVYHFFAEDNREYIIAHIGKLLYCLTNFRKDNTFIETAIEPILKTVEVEGEIYKVGIELGDSKSQAFYGDRRLYILGGNKYFVLRVRNYNFQINEVEDDSETYIPTTTIGITYKDSGVKSQAALDDVNLLTQYRKNKLVSGTYVDDGVSLRTTRFWDYELDTSVNPKNPNDINNIKITIQSLRGVE